MAGVLVGTVVLSALLTRAVRDVARRHRLLDSPTSRSSHSNPTPRLGGVAIALSGISGWLIASLIAGLEPSTETLWYAFVWGAIAAAGTGLLDDLVSLRPSFKLAGECVALLPLFAIVVPTLSPLPYGLGLVFWMFLAVGYTNLFNFMDGSDGLAAGVAVIGAVTFAGLAVPGAWTGVALVLGAAALGFLWFNRSPASVFMGDSGSLFLGAGFAMLSAGLIAGGVSWIAIGLALSPFAVDGSLTLLLRLARRELIWEAHRSHLYQRLLIAGWSHSSVAWLYWTWAGIGGASAMAYNHHGGWQIAALCTSTAASLGVIGLVRWVELRGSAGLGAG